LFYPAVKFKTVEANSLPANAKLVHHGANFRVKPILVHAEIPWCVTQADDAWNNVYQTHDQSLLMSKQLQGG